MTNTGGAFRFDATWRDFAPIAFTNLLLTIVTLGIYRFWATARERRFLWSRTTFIDEPLEWTGTGKELFFGFLLALLLFGLPLFLLQFVLQGLIFRGQPVLAGLLVAALYLLLIALVGVARFRALRYRLSRTLWRGIRGGSDDPGLRYGAEYLGRALLGTLSLGLAIPWAMTKLWNGRMNRMSFGTEAISARGEWRGLMGRFLLFYLLPILLLVLIAVVAGTTAAYSAAPSDEADAALFGFFFVFVFYGLLGLVALRYFSAFYREVLGKTHWAGLEFGFTAGTRDWVRLFLGNIALVIVTLGIGLIFLSYRNWAFAMRHLQAYGTLDLDALGQSETRELRQGEGLLDAFDMGAL